MANQANMNNLEVGARVKGVEKNRRRRTKPVLGRPLAISIGVIMGTVSTAAFFITELDQKEIYLNEIEGETKNLGDQVAALSNENKIKSEQLLDLSNKVLELQGKYARDVTALSTALDKAQEEVTVIFSEVDSREVLLNLPHRINQGHGSLISSLILTKRLQLSEVKKYETLLLLLIYRSSKGKRQAVTPYIGLEQLVFLTNQKQSARLFGLSSGLS